MSDYADILINDLREKVERLNRLKAETARYNAMTRRVNIASAVFAILTIAIIASAVILK